MDQRFGSRSIQANVNAENATSHLTAKVNLTSTIHTPIKPFGDKTNNGKGAFDQQNLKSAFKQKLDIYSSPEVESTDQKKINDGLQFDFDDLDFHESKNCFCCGGSLNDTGIFGEPLAQTLEFLDELDNEVLKSDRDIKLQFSIEMPTRLTLSSPSKSSIIPNFDDDKFKFTVISSPEFNEKLELLMPRMDGYDSDTSTLESSPLMEFESDDDFLDVPKWDESCIDDVFQECNIVNTSVCGEW